MSLYYDPDGKPVSMEKWVTLFEHRQQVAKTTLPGGIRVSTVYLGVNHNWDPEGPPLIYETMVFGPDRFRDIDMARYTTREQAEAGHRTMVYRYVPWWRFRLRRQWK